MRLISLLGLVATVASGYPLEEMSRVEPFKIAEIALDIEVEVSSICLSFQRVLEKKTKITDELLETDFLYAPYILFAYNYKERHWYAGQTDDLSYFKRMLKFKENEPSYRYGIIGAGSIPDAANIRVKLGRLHNTLIVELLK